MIKQIVEKLEPLCFDPHYKHVIWGGTRIAKFKGVDLGTHTHVGESWEMSDLLGHESVVAAGPYAGKTINAMISEFGSRLVGSRVMSRFKGNLPFILKILDAHLDLSVQVHPNDEMAYRLYGARGKNEMWYVIDAKPGAQVGLGFNADYSKEDISHLMSQGDIMHAMQMYDAKVGDIFLIPAGTIHALGAGVMVAEVQQASDITYRIWDYDRIDADGEKRPLHLSDALEALVLSKSGIKLNISSLNEAAKDLYELNGYRVYIEDANGGGLLIKNDFDVCITFMCLKGVLKLVIDGVPCELCQGCTMMIPSECQDIVIVKCEAQYLRIEV